MHRPLTSRALSAFVGVALVAVLASCGARGEEADTTTTTGRPSTTKAARPTQPPTTESPDESTTSAAPPTTAAPVDPLPEAQQALLAALDPLNAAIAAWDVVNGASSETPTLVIRWCTTIGPSLTTAADALQSRNQWAGAEGQVSTLAVATRAEAAAHAECAAAPATYSALDPILTRLRAAEDQSVAAAAAARSALGLPPA